MSQPDPQLDPPQFRNYLTRKCQAILLNSSDFENALEGIRELLITDSVESYFTRLIESHGIRPAEAVRRAELPKDFGRQLLKGERRGRRDYYLQLAFGIGLTKAETQSLLSFLGVGLLYAPRRRDAAILYALDKRYSLMDTQLLLEENQLCPLGDAEEEFTPAPPNQKPRPQTEEFENHILQAELFESLELPFIQNDISAYFERLLSARGLTRTRAIELARLQDQSNLAFQLLNGTRIARNRDLYLRFALGLALSLEETQSLLKFLKKGVLYPLIARDAALIYCLVHHYKLDETQALLQKNGLAPL